MNFVSLSEKACLRPKADKKSFKEATTLDLKLYLQQEREESSHR